MPTVPSDKYHLKTIHEQIDLYDRQIAHLLKFEKFDTDAARDQATRKLSLKRETLVQTAQRLASEGVEFKPNELPRSLRKKEDVEAAAAAAASAIPAEQPPAAAESLTASRTRVGRRSGVPYAGTSLDWQASVREYMEKKGKA